MNHCQSKQAKTNKQKELWHYTLQNANVPPIGDGFALLDHSPTGQQQFVPHNTIEPHTALCIVVLMQY